MKTNIEKLAHTIAKVADPKLRRKLAVRAGALADCHATLARNYASAINYRSSIEAFNWREWDALCDTNTEPGRTEVQG